MLITLLALCIGLWFFNPDFVGSDNMRNTAGQIAMLGIFAIGTSFVIVTGGIDLSVGSIIGLTGVLIAKVSSPAIGGMNYNIWLGIGVAMGTALLIGLVQGLLITRLGLQPFIITLGGMLLIRGVSQVITDGGTISLGSNSPLRDFYGNGLFYTGRAPDLLPLIPYPVLIFLIGIVVATYLLHFTVFGRYIYAIGGNRDAAAYSGIPVKRVETITYVISAGSAGIAGICYAAYIGQMTHTVGVAYELYAIAAAVIGGVSLRGGEGTVAGIVIGAAMMRVIENGINLFKINVHGQDWRLGSKWNFVVIGAVILVAVTSDQIVHLMQERRRTRQAGPKPQGFEVVVKD
jgi:ribose transport system permease protein